MLDKYLQIANINNRKGIITLIDIPARTPICEFGGKIYTDKELTEMPSSFNINDVLQVGPNLYIGPSGKIEDHIRHSCNPNCYIHTSGKRAILYSLYVITSGSELTFDYSSSSTDDLDSWKMNCTCGSPNCRKIISGFQYLNKDIQESYKKDGIAALFIREPIFMRK